MMSETLQERYSRWQLNELLRRYPELRIVPDDHALVLRGRLPFRVVGPNDVYLEDAYRVELSFLPDFPNDIPAARETDGRIPKDYHKLVGNLLCVAVPTEIRIKLKFSPTLRVYVEDFLIPYLYGYSYYEKFGDVPYGQLDHEQGIRQYLAELFRSPRIERAQEFVRCAAMKKRRANKLPCPCGSGRRMGRCHNGIVNSLRNRLGRKWFQAEYVRVMWSLCKVTTENDPIAKWLEHVPTANLTMSSFSPL